MPIFTAAISRSRWTCACRQAATPTSPARKKFKRPSRAFPSMVGRTAISRAVPVQVGLRIPLGLVSRAELMPIRERMRDATTTDAALERASSKLCKSALRHGPGSTTGFQFILAPSKTVPRFLRSPGISTCSLLSSPTNDRTSFWVSAFDRESVEKIRMFFGYDFSNNSTS